MRCSVLQKPASALSAAFPPASVPTSSSFEATVVAGKSPTAAGNRTAFSAQTVTDGALERTIDEGEK